tara:strand:- start:461 stop:715 length:255 start_codon:yes stop_codon:yes gene_type:complete
MCLFKTPKAKAMSTPDQPIETVDPVDLVKGKDLKTEGEKTQVTYGDNKKPDGTPEQAPQGLAGLKINPGATAGGNTGGVNTGTA